MSRFLGPAILGLAFSLTTEAHLWRYSTDYLFVNLIGWLTFYTSIIAMYDEIKRNRRPWMWTSTAIKHWLLAHESTKLIIIAAVYSICQHIILWASKTDLGGLGFAIVYGAWFYYVLWSQGRLVKV